MKRKACYCPLEHKEHEAKMFQDEEVKTKITKMFRNGKEVFSHGWAFYKKCEVCDWKTQKYFENSVNGIVLCDQCGLPVTIDYIQQLALSIVPEKKYKL